MRRFVTLSALASIAILSVGCSSGRGAKDGEKAEFIIVNNAGRPLHVQPMMSSRSAASVDLAKQKDAPVKLFAESGKLAGTASQYVLYVVEKANDLDETVVSVLRLTPEEMVYAEKSGPVRISLEPNKVFLKFGTRFKTYEYTTVPKIAGAMTVEAKKDDKKEEKK